MTPSSRPVALLLPLLLAAPLGLSAQAPLPSAAMKVVPPLLDEAWPSLEAFYTDLHRHPELSGKEVRTAGKVAERLRAAGYEVTTGVGGTGVVGVLKNGKGPVVLLRAELDALPVEEKTGLPYASTVPGVMHACGHDMHLTSWAAAAELLAKTKGAWRGTVVMVAQPAEETTDGARSMIRDGLFTRFPKPDASLAVHGSAELPAGAVTWVAGFTMANVDAADVVIYGKGGHGARPEKAIDPIVIASRTILALQTIVSREKDPLEPAVLTVGSIHGGTKHNVIPDEVRLQMTIRSYSPAVRKQLTDAIVRIVRAEAASAGAPREPSVTFLEGQDATYNDPALTRRLAARLAKEMGVANVAEGRPDMVSEDFGEFGKAAGVPSVLLRVGTVEPARFAEAKAAGRDLPTLHSSAYAPDPGRSIRAVAEVLYFSAVEVLATP